jgi:hypothetical protein
MINEQDEIDIPEDIEKDWQELVNILAQIVGVPAALIMRLQDPGIEVFVSSEGKGNPYNPGDKEHFWGYLPWNVKLTSELQRVRWNVVLG